MYKTIQFQSDLIAMESISGPNALANAVRLVPQFLQNARGFMQQHLVDPVASSFSKRELHDVIRQLPETSYNKLRSLPYPIPAGLRTDYLTYSLKLYDGVKLMADLQSSVLEPYTAWVRRKLGDPKSLASVTGAFEIDKNLVKSLDAAVAAIDECVQKNGRIEATREYGQSIQRNADWRQVADLIDEMNSLFSETKQKAIISTVDTLNDSLDRLFQRIEQYPEEYQASGATVRAIAQATFEVARQVELYALLRGRLLELTQAVNECRNKLKQTL